MKAKDMPLPEPTTYSWLTGRFWNEAQMLTHREEYAAARCAELALAWEAFHGFDKYGAAAFIRDAARTEVKP